MCRYSPFSSRSTELTLFCPFFQSPRKKTQSVPLFILFVLRIFWWSFLKKTFSGSPLLIYVPQRKFCKILSSTQNFCAYPYRLKIFAVCKFRFFAQKRNASTSAHNSCCFHDFKKTTLMYPPLLTKSLPLHPASFLYTEKFEFVVNAQQVYSCFQDRKRKSYVSTSAHIKLPFSFFLSLFFKTTVCLQRKFCKIFSSKILLGGPQPRLAIANEP